MEGEGPGGSSHRKKSKNLQKERRKAVDADIKGKNTSFVERSRYANFQTVNRHHYTRGVGSFAHRQFCIAEKGGYSTHVCSSPKNRNCRKWPTGKKKPAEWKNCVGQRKAGRTHQVPQKVFIPQKLRGATLSGGFAGRGRGVAEVEETLETKHIRIHRRLCRRGIHAVKDSQKKGRQK